MQQIAIYGGGGFGKEIACLIHHINKVAPTWDLIGFFDDGLEAGTAVGSFGRVLGGMNDLNGWKNNLNIVFSIASPTILNNLFLKINNNKIVYPNIIAPNVLFLDETSLQIGKGNVLFFGCKISCDVTIGDFNLLNGSVSLGHDVVLDSFNVLGPMVRVSGCCTVGNNNFFGVQSIVLQGLKIGNNTRIGACSYVLRNTKDGQLYIGNPAKKMDI